MKDEQNISTVYEPQVEKKYQIWRKQVISKLRLIGKQVVFHCDASSQCYGLTTFRTCFG